jgi:branched-chain amino acid transport system permease protein
MVFLDALLNGVLMGGIYGLTALGLTLIFGVMKVINFAHGTHLMMMMYASYWVVELTGIDPYLSLIVVIPVAYLLGYFTQDLLVNPILNKEADVREPVGVLLLTAGLWIFFNNFFLLLFGANFRSAETIYSGTTFSLGSILVSKPLLYAFIISLISTYILYRFLKTTRLGRAIRATGQDRESARLMGINVFRIYNIAFGIGIVAVGIAGVVLIPLFYVHPFAGDVFDIRAFVIVVLGGLGSVPGALLGGIIVGVIESLAGQYFSMTWAAALIYIIFLIVLFIRPSGIFGYEKEG